MARGDPLSETISSNFTPEQIQEIVNCQISAEERKIDILRHQSEAKTALEKENFVAERLRLDRLNEAQIAVEEEKIELLRVQSQQKKTLEKERATAERLRLDRLNEAQISACYTSTEEKAHEPIGNGGCFIQGPYGVAGNPSNFELVLLEKGGPNGRQLMHYWRDNSIEEMPWKLASSFNPGLISKKATSQGSLLFSSYGRLVVLVNEDGIISHYARMGSRWNHDGYLGDPTLFKEYDFATGPPSFLQRKAASGHGDFAALIPQGGTIVYWTRCGSRTISYTPSWKRVATISTKATGYACLVQSTLCELSREQGKLQAIVLEKDGKAVQYEQQASCSWIKLGIITENVLDIQPGGLIQSSYTEKPGAWGNFELILLAHTPNSPNAQLQHWWRDNSDSYFKWHQAPLIQCADGRKVTSSAALIQSSWDPIRPGKHGNYEIVVRSEKSVDHYSRDNLASTEPGTFWDTVKMVRRISAPNSHS